MDAGFEVGGKVWVRDDGKLSFSMKECDQESGTDLNPEHTHQLQDKDE